MKCTGVWVMLFLPLLLTAQVVTPIADIQSDSDTWDGQDVTIEGIVTIGAGVIHSSQLRAYIQDDSGKGMMLFDFDIGSWGQSIVRGNRLRVSGTVEEYQGVTELTDLNATILEEGLSIEDILVDMTVPEAQDYETWEGTCVRVSGTLYEDPYYAGGGTNLNIEDEDGERLTARVWDSTGIDLDNLSMGMTIEVTGALGIYNNASQILPGYSEDIAMDVPDEPIISNVQYEPTEPGPDDPVEVTATVTDDQEVDSVYLQYRLQSETVWTSLYMPSEGGDEYSSIIPPLTYLTDQDDNIVFRIYAYDDDQNETFSAEITLIITGGDDQYTPMADIFANVSQYIDQEVTVRGMVTIGAGILRDDMLNAYIQDTSGVPQTDDDEPAGCALELFDYDITAAYEQDIVRGNILEVTGTVDEYQGTIELIDFTYTVLQTGQPVDPYIIDLAMSDLWSEGFAGSMKGTLVRTSGTAGGISWAGGGTNLTVSAGGFDMTARIWDTADVYLDHIRTGDPLIVTGIVDEYLGDPQLNPGYDEDVLDLIRISPAFVSWEPQPVFADSFVTVRLQVPEQIDLTSVTLQYGVEYTTNTYQMTMNPETGGLFTAALNPISQLTSEDRNWWISIRATNTGGNTVLSDRITIPVYSGKPSFETVEWRSAATQDFSYVQNPFLDEEITLRVEVVDYNGTITEVNASYRLRGEGGSWTAVTLNPAAGDWFEGILPPMTTMTFLDDDYEFSLTAKDDDDNQSVTPVIELPVTPRAPFVKNLRFLNDPQPGDTLQLEVYLYDTDGAINAEQTFIEYWRDYDEDSIHRASLEFSGGNRWNGSIPPQSSGVTVTTMIYSEDDSLLYSGMIPENMEQLAVYTYPVAYHAAILKVPARAFNPFENEVIPIDYYSQAGDKAIIRIYSAAGKLVHTPVNEIIAASDGINRYEWNGRNRIHKTLPMGVYICHLEIIETGTGKSKTATAPIVIGDHLK